MTEQAVDFALGDREPLDERILNVMDEVIPFSMSEIQQAFPTTDYWPLYRALQKLEKKHQIVFYKTVNKKKFYRKTNINQLPHVKANDGTVFPISFFMLKADQLIDERRVWKQLDEKAVNRVPLLFGQLFVIAQQEGLKEADLKRQWQLVVQELTNARAAMAKAIDWIDTVTDHESMTGNMSKFLAVFGGKDSPQTEDLHKFLRFVNSMKEISE
jgi:hypothetical protein